MKYFWALLSLIIFSFAELEAGSSSPGGKVAPRLSFDTKETGADTKRLNVDTIYSEPPLTGFLPSYIQWLPNSKGISYILAEEDNGKKRSLFSIAEIPSGRKKLICIVDTIPVPSDLKKSDKDIFKIGSYEWEKKAERIVFTYRGDVFTLGKSTGKLTRLTQTEGRERNVTFSPDGRQIAYTRENDLYVFNIEKRTELRLTTTGCDTILNGILDWVYMEELFGRGKTRAYWWSPDSRRIAFIHFNESPVPEFAIPDFIPIHSSLKMQRYPKAGDPNPIVHIGVYDLHEKRSRWIDTGDSIDTYIARVYWLEDSRRLAIETLNRAQNTLKLLFANVVSGDVKEILREEDSTWVNITYMKHYYKNKPYFVWNSERDGFSHLYLYTLDGRLIRQLTKGPWVVSELNGVDEMVGRIYFTALKKSILERHLYFVTQSAGNLRRITKESGTHKVKMSPNCRYYIDTFSSSKTPPTIGVYSAKGRKLFTLAESEGEFLSTYELPSPEFFTITSKEGIVYVCSMIKPKDFDPKKKYPVIIYVYGGPHAQVVRNAWGGKRYLWHAMMASRGFIIFSLDNRGAFGRGKAWENPIARQLGSVELTDQLLGIEHLRTFPYVDASRIGIWGWSYGGYMTCTALLRAPDVFKAGAAVAPVTDWRLYDSIYTERYMGRPQDNEVGYENSAPLSHVDSLKAPLLIVHGTSDDNVHMQNTIQLVKKLIEAGKDFDLMLYPRKLHGISGRKERAHLFKKLEKFFEEHL